MNITSRRIALLSLAAVTFSIFQYGMVSWILSEHSLADTWTTATGTDWLVTITLLDGGIFTTCCFIWAILDFKHQRFGMLTKALFIVGMFVLGAVSFLIYLALRKNNINLHNQNTQV